MSGQKDKPLFMLACDGDCFLVDPDRVEILQIFLTVLAKIEAGEDVRPYVQSLPSPSANAHRCLHSRYELKTTIPLPASDFIHCTQIGISVIGLIICDSSC